MQVRHHFFIQHKKNKKQIDCILWLSRCSVEWRQAEVDAKLQFKPFTQKLQTGTRKTGKRLHTLSMKHNQEPNSTDWNREN